MDVNENRRRFARLKLSEAAIAIDDSGYQLGRVSLASGGGMQVDSNSPEALQRMKSGTRMTISVVEPGSATTNTFSVEVLYISGSSVGMQFV
jgi:PilZ domain